MKNNYIMSSRALSQKMEIIAIRNNWTNETTDTYPATSFKCKRSHYMYYDDIMISRRSRGLKLTLPALSSAIRERNFDLDSPVRVDIYIYIEGYRSYVTHLTQLFFKEPPWCEITLNGFEMSTRTISCTFSRTKFKEKSRSVSQPFRHSLRYSCHTTTPLAFDFISHIRRA